MISNPRKVLNNHFFFNNRIISVSDQVVSATSIKLFKNELDTFMSIGNQDMVFNWKTSYE